MPRLPSFSRLREQTQQAPVRRGGPCLGYLASHGCANRRSKHLFAEGAPCLGYLASHGCARRRSKHLFAEGPVPRLPSFSRFALADAASTCSPRGPCLGYLASHGCARRRSKHLFAEVPVPRRPIFSRFCSQHPKRPLSSEMAFASVLKNRKKVGL